MAERTVGSRRSSEDMKKVGRSYTGYYVSPNSRDSHDHLHISICYMNKENVKRRIF